MTVMTHEPSTDKPAREGIAARLLVPGFWGAISIVAMWLTVLFVGIFGGNLTSVSAAGSVTNVPSSIILALFAVIGTASIAKRVFRRGDVD
jgi:hypothetical protein